MFYQESVDNHRLTIALIVRRGGNVGPEEEAIRSQQGQWPHPQVIITNTINKITIKIINTIIKITIKIINTIIKIISKITIKIINHSTFKMIFSLNLISNSEFPLRRAWCNPWHVQV